ncbi:MAG: hypothetical protein ACI4R9_00945 [Kiritimatiellia bacterium]
MNKTTETIKMMMVVGAIFATTVCMARPHGNPGGHGGPRPGPAAPMRHPGSGMGHRPSPPPPRHHRPGDSFWGRGGRNFWPGFVGGVVGGIVYDSIAPAPVVVASPTVVASPVVATPVYTMQNVWVEGRYVDQVQPNGTIVRVWQPGHYEQRPVVVQ